MQPELEQKLSPPLTVQPLAKPLPDFDYIYQELKTYKKFNLTLHLLWREYKEQHPLGYQYSQFCDLYRRYRGKFDYSIRQEHRGGEQLFVDYGEGSSLIDPQSGAPIRNEPSVAVGGVELQLCRSEFDPATVRLDRLSCACL